MSLRVTRRPPAGGLRVLERLRDRLLTVAEISTRARSCRSGPEPEGLEYLALERIGCLCCASLRSGNRDSISDSSSGSASWSTARTRSSSITYSPGCPICRELIDEWSRPVGPCAECTDRLPRALDPPVRSLVQVEPDQRVDHGPPGQCPEHLANPRRLVAALFGDSHFADLDRLARRDAAELAQRATEDVAKDRHGR